MGRLTWLARTLRDAGLSVVEIAGWEMRGRDDETVSMRPRCIIWHHTATNVKTSNATVEKVLVNGRNDLPGPLSHVGLRRDGVYSIIASGKANHAGKGVWRDANESVEAIGIEAYNDGLGESWPQVQLDAYVLGTVALLKKIGRDEKSVCAHREWALPAGRKPDPTGIDMFVMRSRIMTMLKEGDTVILRPGEQGPYIKPWQIAMNAWAKEYKVSGWVVVEEDGTYGPKTKAGVQFYQIAAKIENRVPELGSLDDLTRDLLERYVEVDITP